MTSNNNLLELFRKGGLLFDGAMGSMLISEGLKTGAPPEEWNRSKPTVIIDIHRSYLEAGARIVETNTFGGTPSRLTSFGLGEELESLNKAAVRLAREAVAEFSNRGKEKSGDSKSNTGSTIAREKKFVAFSIGPTGKMLPPVGDASEEMIKAEYAAQIGCVGDSVDLFLIETIFDAREGIIALETAKALTTTPVAVTFTFSRNPRGYFTMMGDEARESLSRLEEAGADIVGANCTITSKEMVELAQILRSCTSLPILCQPNAGSPTVKRGIPVYEQPPKEFAEDAVQLFDEGINAVGGCCGTTPEFIHEVFLRMYSR